MPRKATLYRNVDYTGEALDLSDFATALPPPLGNGDGETSSVKIYVREYFIGFDDRNFGGDQFWIEGPQDVPNLHIYGWGDKIESIAFAPITSSVPTAKSITDPQGKRSAVTIVRKSDRTRAPKKKK